MMLLKRLLLPGKGDLIICILILLNVLLWCGEQVSDCFKFCEHVKYYTTPYVITTLVYRSTSLFSSLSSSSICKYYSVPLFTHYYLISLQFHKAHAQEEVLNALKVPSQQPVFNKTDPLSMKLALQKGGATVIATQHNDLSFNKTRGRRRPVYNNSFVNSSISAVSSGSVISSDSSSFLNDVLVSVGRGRIGLHKDGNGSSIIGDTYNRSAVNTNSSVVNAGVALLSSIRWKHDGDSGSNSERFELEGTSHDGNTNVTTSEDKKKRFTLVEDVRGKEMNYTATKKMQKRKPKLLKELTMLNRQNCLAKLLCGVQVARPPTKSSSALNDYAYLVKAFFDRFSIKGIVTDVIDTAFQYEKDALDLLDDEDGDDDDDDDDTSSERRKKKNGRVKIGNTYIGGAALHKSRTPEYHKYEPKYYDEYEKDGDDVDLEYLDLADYEPPAFMQPDVLRKRKGRSFVNKFNETLYGNMTSKGRKRKRKEIPHDINRIRKRRGIDGEVKRGFMGFFNPRFDKTAYLDKRQLELERENNEARQLSIAEEIAARLRSPRQCRLLNWFKEKGGNNAVGNSNNGMTTTITTITNTGGMIGNMNGLQNGLPPAAVSGNGNSMGAPGSQVVTVIQQSPVGSATPPPIVTPKGSLETPSPAAKAQAMLKNMGQSATNAMEQLSDVASHAASTICPFNIHELQELILKAQIAPFPHFFTTTPPSPNYLPNQVFPQTKTQALAQSATTSTTTTTTTTIKATNPPPQTTTPGKGQAQSRNGLEPPWMGDLVPEPYPTAPRYSPHSHQQHMYNEGDSTQPTPPRYHIRNPSPPPRYGNRHRPNTQKPQRYQRPNTTPSFSSDYQSQHDEHLDNPDHTNLSDDTDLYEEDRYSSYDMNKSPYEQHKVHHAPGLRKKKPVPKWMTTTTPSPEDEYPSYSNDALPNYSYGTDQQIGYKKTTQQPLRYKSPNKQNQQYGGYKPQNREPPGSTYKYPNREYLQQQAVSNKKHVNRPVGSPYNININIKEPDHHQYVQQHLAEVHDDIKIGPDFPKETTVAPTPNYIREFQQPPVVVDSKKYPPGLRQSQQQGRPQRQRPQVSAQSQKEEDSEEDDSETSDEDSNESDSAEGESRSNLMKPGEPPRPERRPPPTNPQPGPPPGSVSVEASDEDDDKSNEAAEKKEKEAENDEEDSEEESNEAGDNDGKRSYERNDFSKDRVGPPADLVATESAIKPVASKPTPGFFSNFMSSFSNLKSYLNRGKEKDKRQVFSTSQSRPTPYLGKDRAKHPPKSNTHIPKQSTNHISSGFNEPEDDDDNDYDEDSDEADEQVKAVTTQKTTIKPRLTVTPKPTPKPTISLQMKSKVPIQPWVNSNTRFQFYLKTTPVPVVIEASSKWPIRAWGEEEDDSDEVTGTSIESLEVVKSQSKKTVPITEKVKKTQSLGLEKFGISPSLNKFLTDVRDAHTSKPNKKDKSQTKHEKLEEVDEEDDESNESEEEDISGPPRNPHFSSYMPRAPRD